MQHDFTAVYSQQFRRVWRLTDRLWVFITVAVLALAQAGEFLVSIVKQPPVDVLSVEAGITVSGLIG